MADQVRSAPVTRDSIKSTVGTGAAVVATALSAGASAIPSALARGWVMKRCVEAGADVLARTLGK